MITLEQIRKRNESNNKAWLTNQPTNHLMTGTSGHKNQWHNKYEWVILIIKVKDRVSQTG